MDRLTDWFFFMWMLTNSSSSSNIVPFNSKQGKYGENFTKISSLLLSYNLLLNMNISHQAGHPSLI